jgi:lipocalin-like protein
MKKLFIPLLFILTVAACSKKSNTALSNEEKIAGASEKTWEASRETNAEGDKDKLTRDEKKEKITFWRNGNVKMGNGAESMSGQWSYAGSTLTLHFTGKDVTENFNVEELSEDKIKLKAADGSTMTMEPD